MQQGDGFVVRLIGKGGPSDNLKYLTPEWTNNLEFALGALGNWTNIEMALGKFDIRAQKSELNVIN